MARKFENPFDIAKSRSYLDIAFRDYVAARVLLNSGLLLQGATLASTGVEKYFKAILTLNRIASRQHLTSELCEQVRNVDPTLSGGFNASFLDMLIRCYKWRYIADLPDNFNIVLMQFALLAELDFTVSKIEEKIHIYVNGKKLELRYKQSWENRDRELLENNYLYLGLSKSKFVESRESRVQCLRIRPRLGLPRANIEVVYTAEKQPFDGSFSKEFVISDYPTAGDLRAGIELPYKARG